MEEVAVMKEYAKQEIQKAEVIVMHSKLEVKDEINAKRSYSSARVDTVTKQHEVSVEKILDNFLTIQSHMQANH